MLIYVYSSKNKENWYQNLKNISTKMKKLSNYCLPNSIGTSIPNNLTLILFALAVANRIIGSPSSWSSFSGCLLHNKRLILFNFLSDIERNRYIQSRLISKWFWKRLVFFCVFFSKTNYSINFKSVFYFWFETTVYFMYQWVRKPNKQRFILQGSWTQFVWIYSSQNLYSTKSPDCVFLSSSEFCVFFFIGLFIRGLCLLLA